MRAAVNTRYGSPDVLSICEVPAPKPNPGEVLIKVHAATVGRTDTCALQAHPFLVRLATGLLRPKRTILGLDFAGTIEALGEGVSKFTLGERVFGLTPGGYGAHAEYVCVPIDGPIATMPASKRYDEAVVCEGAWYADTNLKKFNIGPDHNILIYGASGAIGTSAVQLAKHYGAKVTAVTSTAHLELAKRLGADHVIDYTQQDFTQIDETFDFIFDAVGKITFFQCRTLLKPQGVFSATDLGPWGQNIFLSIWSSITKSRRVIFPLPVSSQEFVEFIKARIEANEFHAVIDRRYPLQDIAEAYRYVETKQKVGIVVVNIVPESI